MLIKAAFACHWRVNLKMNLKLIYIMAAGLVLLAINAAAILTGMIGTVS